MKFKIEDNIPLPESNRRGRESLGAVSYPWHKMAVGDSFAIPAAYEGRARTAAGPINARGEKYFTIRKTETGIRCWRIR